MNVTIGRRGDRALVVRFSARPSRRLTETLAGFCAEARTVPGVLDAIPGHRTVLLEVEPGALDLVEGRAGSLLPSAHSVHGRLHRVRAMYDGPDLGWVCELTGLSKDALVRAHSAKTYDVRLIGSPGFVYLSSPPPAMRVPRREEPRREVPAGSIAIAGRQAGIYARAMPGGWRILGTTPSLPDLRPGDRVRFVPAEP